MKEIGEKLKEARESMGITIFTDVCFINSMLKGTNEVFSCGY